MRKALLLIIPLTALAITLIGQPFIAGEFGAPIFTSKTLFSPSSDETFADIEILITIQNNSLQFVRREDFFRASFDVLLALYDGDRLISKLHRKDSTEVVTWFETSSSGGTFAGTYTLRAIPAGDFRLFISITDMESSAKTTTETKITIPHFPRDLVAIGSIILIDPELNHLEFPNYRPTGDSVHFRVTYSLPESIEVSIVGVIEGDGFSFADTIDSIDRSAAVHFSLPKPIDAKAFVLSVIVISQDSTLAKISRNIESGSQYFFRYAETKEELVEQLALIEQGSELRPLRKALKEAPESLDSLIELFWASKDPTPSTELNELREEFYRRIEIANSRFRSVWSGWRTDRGRIYVLYGEPDEINSSPFSAGYISYEIWYYYNPRRTFYFEDRHGDGTYQLIRQE